MVKVNDNYLKLPGSYLFSTIGKKVNAYAAAHPDKKIIRLGIGDVTQPLSPSVISALHSAVDEMADAATFRGYAPDLGYEFLRTAIAENDYKARGCQIEADEIFVSDGAKCDSGNIQEIFALDNTIAVCDPVYPVYVDTNVMAGRTGTYDADTGIWSDVIYKGLTEESILNGARDAFLGGWNRVKLYFMLGQPTETEEDMKGIAYLSEKVAETFYDLPVEQRQKRPKT